MRWLAWIVGVAALDLLLRLGPSLPFPTVLAAEGILFLGGAGVLAWMVARRTEAGSKGRAWGWGIAAAVAVGGVRSLAWGLGAPVMVANLTVLALAMMMGVGAWLGRRPPV